MAHVEHFLIKGIWLLNMLLYVNTSSIEKEELFLGLSDFSMMVRAGYLLV